MQLTLSNHLLPAEKQLDWEAILATDFTMFHNRVCGWFVLKGWYNNSHHFTSLAQDRTVIMR